MFLRALGVWDIMGEEPKRRTPARVVHAMVELFGGELEPINFTTFPAPENSSTGIVVVKDIQFSSLCAHHHLPFTGLCHVGYVPNMSVVGISKIPRVVEHAVHGASIQEDVTESIAEYLQVHLSPCGVIVLMNAEHTCMCSRGIRKPGANVTTMAVRGCFCDDGIMVDRFLTLIRR
jgi:GTP cyclohydrolase I